MHKVVWQLRLNREFVVVMFGRQDMGIRNRQILRSRAFLLSFLLLSVHPH